MTSILPSKVVTQEHLQKAKDARLKINDALREAKLADQAGILPDGVMDNLKAHQDKLLKFMNVYFPGH